MKCFIHVPLLAAFVQKETFLFFVTFCHTYLALEKVIGMLPFFSQRTTIVAHKCFGPEAPFFVMFRSCAKRGERMTFVRDNCRIVVIVVLYLCPVFQKKEFQTIFYNRTLKWASTRGFSSKMIILVIFCNMVKYRFFCTTYSRYAVD